MAWYDTGTVSVTNGSTAVTGSGTNFVAGAQVGEGFYGPDGRLYEIQAIVSATALTLADAYLGSTQTGQTYKIVPTQSLTADLASQVSTLISDYQSVADNAGEGKFQDGSATSPGITFTQDQDTGFFRDTANEIGVAVAGVKKAEFNSSGLAFGDNDKAIFGDSSDLQIYHDGTDSIINESTAGNFLIQGAAIKLQTANGLKDYLVANASAEVTLYYDNASKLQTTSTGVDVTGTITSDGLTVDGDALTSWAASSTKFIGSKFSTTYDLGMYMDTDNRTLTLSAKAADSLGTINFKTGVTPAERMRITNAGNVGIGNTNPQNKLDIEQSAAVSARLLATGATSSSLKLEVKGGATQLTTTEILANSSGAMTFATGTTSSSERMRITSTGSVGIGTSSPSAFIHANADAPYIKFTNPVATSGFDVGLVAGASSKNAYLLQREAAPIIISTNNTERMRIDSSGRVGIGTTSPQYTLNVGGDIVADGDFNTRTIGFDFYGALKYNFHTDGTVDADKMFIRKGTTNVATFDASGNLGIGTSSPADKLHVDGNIYLGASSRTVYTGGSGNLSLQTNTGSMLFLRSNGASESMRIDSSGNVGIGTSSPSAPLDVVGSPGTLAEFRDGVAANFIVETSSNVTTIGNQAGSSILAFKSSNSEAMRIDSSGAMMVGRTSGSTSSTDDGFVIQPAGWAISNVAGSTSAAHVYFQRNGNTVAGSISSTSSATSYNTSSDYRLKEDVQPMTGASDRVLALKPVNFAWKVDGSRTDGFLAHEAQVVVPEAVTGEKDAVDADGNPQYQGIDQSKLVPLLTAALQEALTEIADLKARVAALEA